MSECCEVMECNVIFCLLVVVVSRLVMKNLFKLYTAILLPIDLFSLDSISPISSWLYI